MKTQRHYLLEALAEQTKGLGKFQGEAPECVYFYDCIGNGDGETLESNGDGASLCVVAVEDEERAAFGLGADVTHYAIQERSDGFVTGWTLTDAELADLCARVERFRQSAEDDLRREIEDDVGPILWTVRLHAHSGCSPIPRTFESEENARACFAASLAEAREEGYIVTELEPYGASSIARAEIEQPDTAVMVSDASGILTLASNEQERAEEIERRMERALESMP